ncbi:MAG: hypothetical protein FWB85_01155 [Chitinispirillia bacterium]|nr:hypothetical protein [Chitinispirillia bacterium]MCL2241267.1 hypothetical protein [Chitinispirillia bacterium]
MTELITGGASLLGNLLSGYFQNRAADKQNAQQLRLANVAREDQLAQNRFNNKLAVEDREFRDKEAMFDKLMARRNATVQDRQLSGQRTDNLIARRAALFGGR